ncbi:MAG: AAA family ATPase [Desulfobulbaceae bacterium]|nr:AAA family ATPase [Desulfobulbaceae bacterium]
MKELYIFFGMIASGKTFLAEAFSRKHQLKHYNTDRVRKELAGVAAESNQGDDFGKGIYTPEFTQKTYGKLLDLAETAIREGKGVILDGSYSTMVERGRVREMGESLGLHPLFVFCGCSEDTVRQRLELRAKDPLAVSDGNYQIYLAQKKTFEQPIELPREELIILDTAKDLEQLLAELDGKIKSGPPCGCGCKPAWQDQI